jgi:hypothetical protein
MSDSEIILPTKRVKAQTQSPKNLIIFSKPKVGKSALLAGLDNCLLIDTEEGSDFLEAMRVKASSWEDIQKIGNAIKESNHKYDYIALDTITALETMCLPYAEVLYARQPIGKNWFKKDKDGNLDVMSGKNMYGSIINLPNGQGYGYLRQAFFKIIDYVKTFSPRVILVGHVKDIVLDKDGSDVNSMELDLTGKIKRIISSQSDAIGYLYRKGNQNILSFKTADTVTCGARSQHLRNKEIVISEMDEEGTLTTYWDKVYID